MRRQDRNDLLAQNFQLPKRFWAQPIPVIFVCADDFTGLIIPKQRSCQIRACHCAVFEGRMSRDVDRCKGRGERDRQRKAEPAFTSIPSLGSILWIVSNCLVFKTEFLAL